MQNISPIKLMYMNYLEMYKKNNTHNEALKNEAIYLHIRFA